MNKHETLALLRQHSTHFEEEKAFLKQTIDFVERNDRFWQRSNLEGHLTGSAWVLSEEGDAALLLHHVKLDRWLQPGGHADDTDASIIETARREAIEECGIKDPGLHAPVIFDLDVHEIPAIGHEPAHFHFDLRFLFFVKKDTELTRNLLETKAVAWVQVHELSAETTPQSIRRMALKSWKIERESERF